MKRFISMVVANFKMMIRNWQSLFWMFLFPLIIMGLLGIVFGKGQGSASISLVDLDKSVLSKNIVKNFQKIDALKVTEGSEKEELAKLKDGKINAVLVIEKGFSGKLPIEPANLKLYYDPAQTFVSQMIRGTISSIISGMDKAMSRAPTMFKVQEKKVQAEKFDYIDFLLPGIIGMAIMNTAIFGLSTTMVSYREKGILRRLKITPIPLSYFLGARIVTQLLFSLVQTSFLIAFAKFAFGAHTAGSYFVLAFVIIVGSLCFINVGFLVSSIAKTNDTADTIGNIIAMPMMFLSGIFFPVDNAPKWIQPLIKVLPLKYLADALRDVVIRGKSLAYVQGNMYVLLGVTVVLFLLSLKLFKWESTSA